MGRTGHCMNALYSTKEWTWNTSCCTLPRSSARTLVWLWRRVFQWIVNLCSTVRYWCCCFCYLWLLSTSSCDHVEKYTFFGLYRRKWWNCPCLPITWICDATIGNIMFYLLPFNPSLQFPIRSDWKGGLAPQSISSGTYAYLLICAA